jgi:hypothetical protein
LRATGEQLAADVPRRTRVARVSRVTGAVFLGAVLFVPFAPASACGVTEGTVPQWLPGATALLSLIVALVLLGAVIRLRRLVFGAAITSYTSYVVAAVLCLVTSALVYWFQNLVPFVRLDQAVLASNLLVTASMGLLVLYFANVRSRLRAFEHDLRGSLELSDEGDTVRGAQEDDDLVGESNEPASSAGGWHDA